MFMFAITIIVLFVLFYLLSLLFGDSKKKRDTQREERRNKAKEQKKGQIDTSVERELELAKYEKNISQFNIADIGRPYKAISFIESSHKVQTTARQLICEQAHKLGANAIINMQLQTEVSTYGGGKSHTDTKENLFIKGNSTSQTTSRKIRSYTTYIYTGTAVILD